MDLHEEAGKQNEQTLANLSPTEEATSKDEIKMYVFVPLLLLFSHIKNILSTELGWSGTDLTAFGLYWRPRSRFSHTDLLLG